jgi:hypothetical protein
LSVVFLVVYTVMRCGMFANGIIHTDTDQLRPVATSAEERLARAAEALQACLWLVPGRRVFLENICKT